MSTNLEDILTTTHKIVKQCKSYDEYVEHLSTLTDNKLKGDIQECFIGLYFESHRIHYNVKKYYARVLGDLPDIDGINNKDWGVDGYIEHNDGKFSFVQVKFRSDMKSSLTREVLGNMVLEAGPLLRKNLLHNIYLVSNTNSPPTNVSLDEIESYNIKYILSNILFCSEVWITIKMYVNNLQKKAKVIVNTPLRKWQKEALDFIFNNGDNFGLRTVVAPCGAGKSRLASEVAKKYNRVLAIVPTLHLLSQMFMVFGKYQHVKGWRYLLVGSDAEDEDKVPFDITTDPDLIASYDEVENLCVISTYQSLDKIDMSFDLVICDEAHLCCSTKDNNYSLPIDEEYPVTNKLFITATPKTYTGGSNGVISMDDEEIFGPMYKYSLKRAIDDGVVNNYNIIVGHSHIDLESTYDDISFNALFLRRVIIETKINSVLIFSNSHKDSKLLYNKINESFKQAGIDDYQLILLKANATSEQKAKITRLIESGKKIIVLNVRVFALGSDLPKLEGVMLCGGKSSKIDIVQSVSRCLRKVKGKPDSRILIPCLVRGDDYKGKGNFESLRKFLLAMGTVDEIIFNEIRGIGGSSSSASAGRRINFMDMKIEVSSEITDGITITDENFELMIYDRAGANNTEEMRILKWRQMLSKVIEYIETNGKAPSTASTCMNISRLGRWLIKQRGIHKLQKDIMKIKQIREEWEEVTKQYPMLNGIDNNLVWYDRLNKVIEFCEANDKAPSAGSKILSERKLGQWLTHQRKIYRQSKFIMSYSDIRHKWEEAIKGYPLLDNPDNKSIWCIKLNRAKDYVRKHNKPPDAKSSNKETRNIAVWLRTQRQNYLNFLQIMKHEDIREEWEQAVKQCPKLNGIDNKSIWRDTLNQTISHIQIYDKSPSEHSNDIETRRLGKWRSHQCTNYKLHKDIMKHEDIREEWEQAVKQCPKLNGIDNESIWRDKLERCKTYNPDGDKILFEKDTELRSWVLNQRNNYKKCIKIMSKNEIREKWEEAIGEYTFIWPNFEYVENNPDALSTKTKSNKLTKAKLKDMTIQDLIELASNLGKEDADEYTEGSRIGKGKAVLVKWIYDNQTDDISSSTTPTNHKLPTAKSKRKIVVKR
jgi:superfamily II DNA or RNA helicase